MFDSGTAPAGVNPGVDDSTALISRLLNEAFQEEKSPRPSESPAVSPGIYDLSGGFPSITQDVPPVHSNVEPEPSDSARLETLSGAHEEELTHAFGEPDCYARSLSKPSASSPSLDNVPSVPCGLPETPSFYFLPSAPSVPSAPPRSGTVPTPSFDLSSVRRDFPALNQTVHGRPLIWLDNAATTQKPQVVLDATSQFYGRDNSNIHRAAHVLAERSTKHYEEGRDKVRQFLGAADAKEIVFLRGTTEAINLVANSYGRKHIGAGDEIILTELEHHANIVPWQILAESVGASIKVIPINDRGELILEELEKLFTSKTKFLSVAHVSNSLGTINPVEQIIPIAHAHGVPVLVDGAQSTPHLPVNVTALDADFYVFSGHKVFGPTGIGALYGKAHLLEDMPPWQGGGHMIRDVRFEKTEFQHAPEKFEAGTPDIAGVVGLTAAIDYMFHLGIPAIAAYEHHLLEYATGQLATVPGLRPIGTAHQKASVLSFVIPGFSNDHIARHLDDQGIAVRAGHHCAMPAQRKFGLESTVRPSLAFYNSREDVDALVRSLKQLVSKSPR